MNKRVRHRADNIAIAPGCNVRKWKSLDLRNTPACEEYWQEAADIVESRLVARYFSPCRLLIDTELAGDEPDYRFGFVIMAINCLLVETLQSFIMGKASTKDQSRELSREFLRSAPSFREDFSNQRIDAYYTDVRCGLLHIGETQNMALIRAIGPLVSERAGGIVINRTKFHEGLRNEFDRYLSRLRDPVPSQRRSDARRKMKAKMDFICRVTAQ